MHTRKAFTLLETLLTVSVIAVLATVSILGLTGSRRKADLDNTTVQIGALLRQAQSNAMSQAKGSLWGVHFDNIDPTSPFYSLFYTSSTYASSTPVGRYVLPRDLCYATSSVGTGSTLDVIFGSISGAPSASTTLTLQLMTGGGCATATSSGSGSVTRSASGRVFFDDFNRTNL